MRYGPSLAAGYLNNSSSYHPMEVERDTCPATVVECDGVKHCKLGSDETNCGQSPSCGRPHASARFSRNDKRRLPALTTLSVSVLSIAAEG